MKSIREPLPFVKSLPAVPPTIALFVVIANFELQFLILNF